MFTSLHCSSLYTLRQILWLHSSADSCWPAFCEYLLSLLAKAWTNRQAALLTIIQMSSRDSTFRDPYLHSKHFAHWEISKDQEFYFNKNLSFLLNKWESYPCHLQLFQFKIAPIGGSVYSQRTENITNRKIIDFSCDIVVIRVTCLLQSHNSMETYLIQTKKFKRYFWVEKKQLL